MSEISRRKFIQLTVLGSAVAASGCDNLQSRFDHDWYKAEVAGQYGGYANRVYPYLNQPDGTDDGVWQYFATACNMCPAGCGLFLKTMGGRAILPEGNPAHPVAGGKVCARGAAGVQHLYNPDRIRFPALTGVRGEAPAQTEWEPALARTATALQGARGRAAVLVDAVTVGRSPTLMGLVTQFARDLGATVTTYSLLDDAPWRAAARAVYGRDQVPAYRLDEADFLISFGGDFLEAWPSPVYYNRLFGEFRQGPRRAQGEHGRFVYVGPRMSMTAAKADQWLPCNPGTEAVVAAAVLTSLRAPGAPLDAEAATCGLSVDQIRGLADGFRAAGARAVAVPGSGLMTGSDATAAFTAVEALNAQAGSRCVGFGTAALPLPNPSPGGGGAARSSYQQVQALIGAMQAGQVGALLILGQPNPVFTLPAAVGLGAALAKVPFIAALTPFLDETSAHAHVLLPTRAYLEEWGDDVPAVIPPGVRMATLRQPVIDPQFIGGNGIRTATPPAPWMDTRMTGDILLDLARRLGRPLAPADMRDAVRRTWATIGQADLRAPSTDNDRAWVTALSHGGYWATGAAAPAVGRAAAPAPAPAPAASGTFLLHLYPHIYWTDGRHANLPWLQENPDPMTMAVWNSWVEINMDVAHRMGIRTGDIVRLTTAHGVVDVPAVPYPGLHPDAVAMPIGQGHTAYGRYAQQGENPLTFLDPTADATTGALAFGATRVKLEKLRDATAGYHPELQTLVQLQDRPGGHEPDAVKDLIHTTAREWKEAKRVYGAPQAEGSIFKRTGGGAVKNQGFTKPGE